MQFKYKSKVIQNKGKLVYEYNPLYNYRKSFNPENNLDDGTIVEMITEGEDQLNFNLEHPVDIQCQESYDGSVNLVLNDGYNQPRLINTRFTALENNTYERRDRSGNTDTNIYDENEFEIDTSLVKKYKNIPKLIFSGVYSGGELPVGNYTFYFKLSDGDGNETDVVAESGLVTVYIGSPNSPNTIRGGEQDENSGKLIQFKLTNIDSGYDYVTVYYTRATGVDNKPRTVVATKILNKYRIKSGICPINITGHEQYQHITIDDINQNFFIATKAKTQAICQNMLILGNVSKDSLDYEQFSKVSLGFVPYYQRTKYADEIGTLDELYSPDRGALYYDVKNIYHKVGYWNEEIYRFGVVYIMNNGSLSPVYNIRGINEVPYYTGTINDTDKYTSWEEINIDYDTSLINQLTLENSAGVCRINDTSIDSSNGDNYFYVRNYVFVPQQNVKEKLKELGVKGYFFVRQKRIPTILCQAFVLGRDIFSGIPAWKLKGGTNSSEEYWVTEGFLDATGKIVHDYGSRLIPLDKDTITNSIAICPEYELNQPYYNNIFTGGEIPIKQEVAEETLELDSNHIYATKEYTRQLNSYYNINIQSVPDSGMIRDKGNLFKARAGSPEDISFEYVCNKAVKPYKDKFAKEDDKYTTKWLSGKVTFNNFDKNIQTRIVRGNYGTYPGMYGKFNVDTNSLINIYTPGYNSGQMLEYFKIRFNCEDEFYTITDRFSLNEIETKQIYRGDCYISQFTHRINRNFQDPDAPNNEMIVDEESWINNYNTNDKGKEEDLGVASDVNRGDLNAVRIGTYITFRCYTSYNIAFRDFDRAYPAEEALTGCKRSFYPLSPIRTDGNYKIPESSIYNQGFSATVGEKYHFLQPAVPYLKNTYQTRLIYSDIAQNDSFKNGFRIFKSISFRDYSGQYGGIVKLVEWAKNLVIVFEHAIAFVRVSEDVMLPTDDGTKIAVGAVKAISDTPIFISTDYGSQWHDSICTSDRYIYGIDTYAKKIWRTDGKSFEAISDLKLGKFLNNNITLGERELSPLLGIRNVKTHYNRYKEDVMFTFYDNMYGFEEKAWNICYNELTQTFTTFYSWIPSFSANIQNIFFSYDRNSSKWISKLAQSLKGNAIGSGICVDNVIVDKWDATGTELSLQNRPLPDSKKYDLKFILKRDNFGFYKFFRISDDKLLLNESLDNLKKFMLERNPQYYCVQLNIKCEITINNDSQYQTQWDTYSSLNYDYYQSQIFLTLNDILNNNKNTKLSTEEVLSCPQLVTDFWKHGFGGIFDIQEKIKPCYWYGKQHPFEYEFVIGSSTPSYKMFDNLVIISNNVKPDSIHYSIIGDSYDFGDKKPSMYFRQEATKAFYQFNGSDILYDHKPFDKINGYEPKMITSSEYIERDSLGNPLRTSAAISNTYKDTLTPLIYSRQDTFNEIEDYYKKMLTVGQAKDYNNYTGCEIYWDSQLNEFSLCNHVKIRDVKNVGRIRGNLEYVNDKMMIQISPIIVYNANNTWTNNESLGKLLPILYLNNIPQEVYNHILTKGGNITNDDIPGELKNVGYNDINYLSVKPWSDFEKGRKEIKLMDKFMKIKVRYDGTQLATIQAVASQFNSNK